MRIKCVSPNMKNLLLPDGSRRTFPSNGVFDCTPELGEFLISKYGKEFKLVPGLPEIPLVTPKKVQSYQESFKATVNVSTESPMDDDEFEFK